jgi:hypothetical protein
LPTQIARKDCRARVEQLLMAVAQLPNEEIGRFTEQMIALYRTT